MNATTGNIEGIASGIKGIGYHDTRYCQTHNNDGDYATAVTRMTNVGQGFLLNWSRNILGRGEYPHPESFLHLYEGAVYDVSNPTDFEQLVGTDLSDETEEIQRFMGDDITDITCDYSVARPVECERYIEAFASIVAGKTCQNDRTSIRKIILTDGASREHFGRKSLGFITKTIMRFKNTAYFDIAKYRETNEGLAEICDNL